MIPQGSQIGREIIKEILRLRRSRTNDFWYLFYKAAIALRSGLMDFQLFDPLRGSGININILIYNNLILYEDHSGYILRLPYNTLSATRNWCLRDAAMLQYYIRYAEEIDHEH